MSRYSFEESIRDGATLPLQFEPRLVDLRIDRDALDEEFDRADRRTSATDDRDGARQAAQAGSPCWSRRPSASQPSAPTSPSTSRTRSRPRGSGHRSSLSTRKPACSTRRPSTQHLPPEVSDVVDLGRAGRVRRVCAVTSAAAMRRRSSSTASGTRPIRSRSSSSPPSSSPASTRRTCRHVPRQAAARPHAAAGDLPHQPAHAEQDPRPDRRLPRRLRRRRQGARVRRADHPAAWSSTSTELKDELAPAMQTCLAYFPGVDRTVDG